MFGEVVVFFILCGAFFAFIIVVFGLFTVSQQSAKIVERFGKFNKIATSGLNFRIPFIDRVVTVMNLRIQQLDIEVETKSKDNECSLQRAFKI